MAQRVDIRCASAAYGNLQSTAVFNRDSWEYQEKPSVVFCLLLLMPLSRERSATTAGHMLISLAAGNRLAFCSCFFFFGFRGGLQQPVPAFVTTKMVETGVW